MPRQRARRNKIRPVSAKEISVLAWIQDTYGNVLFIRQAGGKQLWSLPGGKVRAQEPIEKALRREIKEEIGLSSRFVTNLDLFDRPKKSALAILFRVTLREGQLQLRDKEIQDAAFLRVIPTRATPSARYFWRRHFPGAALQRPKRPQSSLRRKKK